MTMSGMGRVCEGLCLLWAVLCSWQAGFSRVNLCFLLCMRLCRSGSFVFRILEAI